METETRYEEESVPWYVPNKEKIRNNFYKANAIFAETTPIGAAYEMITGISIHHSLIARTLFFAAPLYVGAGAFINGGRNVLRKILRMEKSGPEIFEDAKDAAYFGLFNIITSPIPYYISGVRDPWKIAQLSAWAGLIGLLNGPFIGYTVDSFMDLAGIKECERPTYPDFMKNLGSKARKRAMMLAMAASIALTGGIYEIAHVAREKPVKREGIEYLVSQPDAIPSQRIEINF